MHSIHGLKEARMQMNGTDKASKKASTIEGELEIKNLPESSWVRFRPQDRRADHWR